MENIAKNSPNSLSPTDESKSDASMDVSPTQNVDVDVARIEGGRSSGGEERLKRHSSHHENKRIPWLVEELASGQGITINHKRKKLYEGDDEVISEEISKKLSLNGPSTQVKNVKVSDAQENGVDLSTRENKDVRCAIRFDLNYPPIDEGDDEVITEVVTLKTLFPSLDDPATQKNEIDPSNGEHNDVDHAIRFDLNNPPIDEDTQVSTDLSLATTEAWNGVVESVNINVRCFNGSKFPVQVTLKSTVESFKNIIARNRDIPAEQQRLIYKGRILKDDQTLQSYGLEADHDVYLVRRFAPTNTNGGTSSTGTNTTTSNARGAGVDDGGGLGGVGLGAGLGINGTGGNGLFGEGFPDLEQMQQPFISNPDLMIEIMNTPTMQNLMNNPEIVQNLIVNNPEVQELMDRNPELAHIVNDPSTLREKLEAPRNPKIMREMMRNMDMEMNNIESSPEGFNMLRRMYEDDEAFLNATTTAGDTGISGTLGGQATDQSTNPSTAASETIAGSPFPNTNSLPNPWSSTGTGGAQAPIGLGGLGLPDLEGMLGGNAMPDAALLTQSMQNPAISQMMQSMLSNPQTLSQILGANTEQQGMPDLNSLREVLQNMEFLRLFSSPETLQQPLSFQQALPSLPSQPQSTWVSVQTSGGTGSLINLGLELLSSMFGELGAGNLAVPDRSNEPLEQLYAAQLSQLQGMGFFDTQENIRALIATSGNVQAAVERLLRNSGQ